MTAQHTPGPWHFSENLRGGAFEIREPDSDAIIADIVDGAHVSSDDGDPEIDWETQEANARLIAAAPELLAALEDVCGYCAPLSPRGKAAIDEARAIIAKAKGAER